MVIRVVVGLGEGGGGPRVGDAFPCFPITPQGACAETAVCVRQCDPLHHFPCSLARVFQADGATPTFIASENGHTQVTKILLDYKAAPDNNLSGLSESRGLGA